MNYGFLHSLTGDSGPGFWSGKSTYENATFSSFYLCILQVQPQELALDICSGMYNFYSCDISCLFHVYTAFFLLVGTGVMVTVMAEDGVEEVGEETAMEVEDGEVEEEDGVVEVVEVEEEDGAVVVGDHHRVGHVQLQDMEELHDDEHFIFIIM